MRPLHLLLDRIRWDPRLDASRFRVRWTRRGQADADEPLPTFLARRDVPHHRVRALACDGVVVWDRDDGVDEFDGVVGAAADVVVVRSFAFWNVAANVDVAADVALFDVDVVGLAEVDDAFVAALRARSDRQLIVEGSVALLVPPRAWRVSRLPLPGRDGLLIGDGDLHVAVAHLTSNVHGDRSERRREQRDALNAALPTTGRLVVLLDANDEADLDVVGCVDVGASAGPTWKGTAARAPRRIDRIFVRGVDTGRVVVERDVDGSDHWPLIACAPVAQRAFDDPQRALCIVPPPPLSTSIDLIRRDNDAAFGRWPPHINVAFPFVDDLDVYAAVARAVVDVAPFVVRLGDSAVFGRGKVAATVVDDGGCAALMALVGAAPSTPHLTLTSNGVAARVDGEFVVDRVVVLARDGDVPFAVVEEFVFGAASLDDAVRETGLCEFPKGAATTMPAALSSLPGKTTLVGSSALGVRFVDSDVDVAWEPPPDIADPLAFLLEHVGGRRVDAVAAPRINTVIDGVDVDVVIGAADARRSATARLSDAQRDALRALRLWARRRGLRNQHNNATERVSRGLLPSSVAWLGLVLDVDDGAPAEILRSIWRRVADEDDVDAVSGTGFRGVTPSSLATLRREAARAAAFVGADVDGAPWRAIFAPRLVD